VAILSYAQKLTYGLLVDPKLIGDVWYLAGCLQESYAELRAVAGSSERSRPEAEPVGERSKVAA
jgi:hypothetical protein